MKKLFTILMLLAASIMSAFATETVIWTGSNYCDGTSETANQELGWGGYDWSKVEAGTTLKVNFTEDETKEYWQITLGVAGDGWKALSDDTDWHNLTQGQTEFSVVLTEDMLTRLSEKNGLVFTGKYITVTSISLVTDAPEPTTDEIDLTQDMTSIWSATYDKTTQTVTWTDDSWGGAGWWYGDDSEGGTASKDCSGYTKVVYEFDGAAPAAGGIEIKYTTGDAGWTGFEKDATSVEYTFDATRSAHVAQIVIKLGAAESLKLSKVYFVKIATGINEVSGPMAQVSGSACYNVAGQKVSENAKGLVIMNGKKVIK